jgi:hypothetical protein
MAAGLVHGPDLVAVGRATRVGALFSDPGDRSVGLHNDTQRLQDIDDAIEELLAASAQSLGSLDEAPR